MRTGPMSESEGTLSGWGMSIRPCPYCGSDQHRYKIWESNDGAYEDEKHECMKCGKVWWVDGIDS